ncbi:YihY/virulence factor BrkB family protein [Actinomyces vulturis]|uniref:YihY/virulence factor BrkB family protein n=1 Tax=Actinomyces vulturis TaxID=1857645 RepID=UPI00082E593C|nr:YihY/virulence factor BrkB family protein [Actinomyces vulturis]
MPPAVSNAVGVTTTFFTTTMERFKQSRLGRALFRFLNVGGTIMSGGIAYSGLFSLFAGLAIGISVIMSVVGKDSTMRTALVDAVNGAIPGLLYDGSSEGVGGVGGLVDIDDLTVSSALNVGSITGLIALFFSALGVMGAIKKALRSIFGIVAVAENPVIGRLRDLGAFIVVGVGVLATAVAGAATSMINSTLAARWDIPGWVGGYGSQIGVILASFLIDAGVLAMMIRVAGIRAPKKDLIQGACLGAIAFGILRIVGTRAVSASSNPLLASFAAIVVLLLWLHLAARVLLIVAAWIANPPAPVKVDHPQEVHMTERPNYVTVSVPATLAWPHQRITGALNPDPTRHPDYIPPVVESVEREPHIKGVRGWILRRKLARAQQRVEKVRMRYYGQS